MHSCETYLLSGEKNHVYILCVIGNDILEFIAAKSILVCTTCHWFMLTKNKKLYCLHYVFAVAESPSNGLNHSP